MIVFDPSISATLMRQVWGIVEETQSSVLLTLNDTDLVYELLIQLQSQRSLDCQEREGVVDYLTHRLGLIRDLAADRRGLTY